MQCMVSAASSVGAASGIRSWLGARFGPRIGAAALGRITVVLAVAAVLASGMVMSGSSAPVHSSPSVAHAAPR